MKSYFTKFGALLLCGVMLAVVGCHDYDEDINKVDDKVNTLVGQVEDLDTELNKALADLETSLKDNYATKEVVNGIQSSLDAAIKANADDIKKANAEIQKNTGGVATNATAIAEAKTSISNLQKALTEANDKIAAAEAAIALKANDAELKALAVSVNDLAKDVEAIEALLSDEKTGLTALNSAVASLNASVSALESGLKTANDNIASNLKKIEDLQKDVETAKQNIADNAAAIKVLADADLITRVAALEGAQKTLETSLATKVAELTKAYGEADAALKADLLAEIKKVNDDLTTVKTNVTNLQTSVSAIQTTIATLATTEALNKVKGEIEEAYKDADAKLKDLIDGLTERVEEAEKDIASLIKRVQSIVYVPTHVDGMARINYAKLGDEILEGFSTLTYKVYPAELAADLAKVAKNFTYDVITVTKSNVSPLQVIDVTNPEGTNVIEVKALANGLDLLYDPASEQSYAAALVLSDDDNHYSTEYTNLVADASASKEIKMELYLGNEPYDYVPVKYEWPFVATGDGWEVTLLKGLDAKFAYNGKIFDATTLMTEYGYNVEYTREITYKSREENQKSMRITKPENNAFDSYVTVCPPADGERVNASYMKDYLEVTYTFACADSKLSGSATVGIVDFPYTLQINSKPLDKPYEISYVDDKTSHVVLENMIDVLYHDANGNGILRSEIEKMFPALNPKFGVELTGFNAKGEADKTVVDLFEVTGDSYAVTVALKKDENGLLAKKEDVGSVMNVKYTFDVPVLKRDVQSVSADVKITEATSSFPLGTFNAVWTYMEDVYGGAYDKPATRTFTLSPVADSNGAVYTELPFANPTSLVVKKGEETVNNVTVAFAAEGVTVTGFEWNASYSVEAKYNVEIDGIIASIATVVFDFTTAKPELPVFTLTFSNSDMYAANMVKSYENSLAGLWQLDATYQGAGFVEANWLKDVLVDNAYTVVNTIEYTEGDTKKTVNPEETETANNLVISADGSKIATAYDYKGYKTVPTSYAYSKKIVTYYGQEILINASLDFTLPSADYAIRHVTVWVKDNNSIVNPLWQEKDGKVSGFDVDQVKLREAFVVTKKGKDLTVDEVAAENLDWVFSLELDDVPAGTLVPTMNDLYEITYISPLPEVGVDCKLYLVNTVDGVEQSRVELDTNYDEDYADYVVKKYDPLKSLEFSDNPIEVQLDGPDTYVVNLAQNLNVIDKLDRVFIKDGDIFAENYIYDSNYFGLELSFGAIKENLGDFAKYIDVDPVADMRGNVIDCIVKFNYDNKMNVREDAVVTIPVTYTYFWGKLTQDIKVVFKKPVEIK